MRQLWQGPGDLPLWSSFVAAQAYRSPPWHARRRLHHSLWKPIPFVHSFARSSRTVVCRSATCRFWASPADGEVCDACDKPITKQQLVMEGSSNRPTDTKPLQLHITCFQTWDVERRGALKS
jgi:hypothetical protein